MNQLQSLNYAVLQMWMVCMADDTILTILMVKYVDLEVPWNCFNSFCLAVHDLSDTHAA